MTAAAWAMPKTPGACRCHLGAFVAFAVSLVLRAQERTFCALWSTTAR